MSNTLTGWLFIGLGIVLLIPVLPFPDLSMSVVHIVIPSDLSLLIQLLLPLLYIVFGITAMFTRRFGKLAIFSVTISLLIVSVWAVPNLGIIKYYEPGMNIELGAIEAKVLGLAALFIIITALSAYELMHPNNQIKKEVS